MEQHALKNVNYCWNINISFYLETSGDQNSNLYLNVVHVLNTSTNNTSVPANDNCILALVSNTWWS